jgi:hypothetical protein
MMPSCSPAQNGSANNFDESRTLPTPGDLAEEWRLAGLW